MCTSDVDDGASGPALTGEERQFLSTALAAWAGASSHRPATVWPLREPSRAWFDVDVVRLRARLASWAPRLSTRDWTLVLTLAEAAVAHDLLGAAEGAGFVSAWTAAEAATLLRSVQRALSGHVDPPPASGA